MAEAGQDIEHLLGQGIIQQAVLQHGTNGAGCALRTQGKLGFLCGDGVHFFLYHVSGLAHGPQEQIGVFKSGDPRFVEAEAFCGFPCNAFHRVPLVDLLRGDIFCALRACDFDFHV